MMWFWWNQINKIVSILDKLPELDRTVIIKKYSWEGPSGNVKKLVDIFKKLSEEEKTEFFLYINSDINESKQQDSGVNL